MNSFRNHALLHEPSRRGFSTLVALGGALLLIAATACSTGSSPTEPGSAGAAVTLSSASVLVGGQPVGGSTIHPGQGASTRFEARLSAAGGAAPGLSLEVHFDRPMGMGMMGSGSGTFRLYDDGTHGDHVAGDHLFTYEDTDGAYGCHMGNAAPGEYHYDFVGQDDLGHRSNHTEVMVRLTR